ncbi:MAG TPA: OmpH family outer membrane protein [Opitutaceae bacterium]|nr:OmpH family outer membrane protein [Opitutaceae bacterium]
MKKLLHAILGLGAFGTAALYASAEPALKIVVVDMAKIYDSDWKTQDEMTKLNSSKTSAQQQFDQMTKDQQALVDQYKQLDETAKNPLTSPEAKTKAQGDQQKLGEQIQSKRNDQMQFAQTVQREFQQQITNFHDLMMEEIGAKATEVAKAHGATLVLDKSGVGVLGARGVIYSDAAYDITPEVLAAVNKDRPASVAAPAPSAAAPASTGTAAPSIPQITVPGVTSPSK